MENLCSKREVPVRRKRYILASTRVEADSHSSIESFETLSWYRTVVLRLRPNNSRRIQLFET